MAIEKPKLHVVSFSGGKDSTAMLLRMIEEKMPIDDILFCDTGLEFPEMIDHINKVEKYIERPITRIKSERNFMWYATEKPVTRRTAKVSGIKPGDNEYGYGWPNMFTRWCTSNLKTDVIKRYLQELINKYEIVQYVGIASDEPKRIKEGKRYPLVQWGMTEKECLQYCYNRGFNWNGIYDIWDRISCYCCPLQSLEDLRKLKKYRPELWENLRRMDEALSKTCRPNFKFTKSFTDIELRFEVEDEFISHDKKLRTKEFFQTLRDRGINY